VPAKTRRMGHKRGGDHPADIGHDRAMPPIPIDGMRIPEYDATMIRSFADRDTERLFQQIRVRRFAAMERAAHRKLLLIDNAEELGDLNVPPGNRLEALKGDRQGEWSIRINDQWRICFNWRDNGAENVEIVDYHR
jgi:toxin HigB-1